MTTEGAQPGGTGYGMDADETLVKERFDNAVGGLSPDVVSLIGGGVAVGRGIRRRRRLMGVGGVAAATVLAAGALSMTGGLGSLFDSKGAGPSGPTLTQRVPATPRGLAAAVMTHTDGLGTLIGVGGQPAQNDSGMLDLKSGIMAELGYQTSSGVKVDLQVIASGRSAAVDRTGLCATGSSNVRCREITFPDGTKGAVISSADGLLGVADVRDDQVVIVLETIVNSHSTPLSVKDLEDVASDPVVGLTTTTALNAQGLTIPDFKNTLDTSSGGSSSGSSGGTATTTSVGPPVVASSAAANGSSGSGTAKPR